MSEKILQCCYTNLTEEKNGIISSGWVPVAVSDNLPTDAKDGCLKKQTVLSAINKEMKDEQGEILNLLEVSGDGSYIYVMRTQYGLKDRTGTRDNMFSHAYVFPCKGEDIVTDPNVFLTLTRDNFVADLESAEARKAKEALDRTPAMTLNSALERSGMTGEGYLQLIRCVYAQYVERRNPKPLYVQYDGTEEQLAAIAYCVYYGVPHSIRRNLSIANATANGWEKKNLIFTRNVKGKETWIIPQTGENNLLNSRVERRIGGLGFVEYAPRNFADVDVAAYFSKLEKAAVALGDPNAANELMLKIAYLMMEGKEAGTLTDEELDLRISDALRAYELNNRRMESYIALLLDEVRGRKQFLTEENEASLAQWLEKAGDTLANAGEQYNIYRLSSMTIPEAVKLLSNMNEAMLERYIHTLVRSEKGVEILDHFYAKGPDTLSWESLNALLEQTAFLPSRPKTLDRIDAKGWELYGTHIGRPGCAKDAYHSLMELMGKLTEDTSGAANSAKELYWERKSFDSFALGDLEEYKLFAVNSDKCKLFSSLYYAVNIYSTEGEEAFLKAVNHFFVANREYLRNFKLEDTVLAKVKSELALLTANGDLLADWMDLAVIAEPEELYAEILVLRKALNAMDYAGITAAMGKIRGVSGFMKKNAGALKKVLGEMVKAKCVQMDAGTAAPVPLELWLEVGRYLYENPFQVLDEGELQILEVHEADVAESCPQLQDEKIQELAEDYIQAKGLQARAVRRWLNEVKAAEKRKRAEERKARGESDGGFMDSVMGLGKSLFNRGNQEPEKPEKQEKADAPVSRNDSGELSGWNSEQRGFRDPEPEKEPEKPKKAFFKDLFGRK